MNKPYSYPKAINPSVTHDAVARSVSVISITLFDFPPLAYLFTKLKLKLMFSYLFNVTPQLFLKFKTKFTFIGYFLKSVLAFFGGV